MATTQTPWTGKQALKLYLNSGQFTSTIRDSEGVGAIESNLQCGEDSNGDFAWTGITDDKFYLQSGTFTSTIKVSTASGQSDPRNASYDGTNTGTSNAGTSKILVLSGQFTSTVKDSENISGIDNVAPVGASLSDVNFAWTGLQSDKLYLNSGKITSTLKSSHQCSGDLSKRPNGVSWDGTNSPWQDPQRDYMVLQSGQFTSTTKTSLSVGAVDNDLKGISTDDYNGRLNITPPAPAGTTATGFMMTGKFWGI